MTSSKNLCFSINAYAHSSEYKVHDLYAPSTMASDYHSTVCLYTSKRRSVILNAIDASYGYDPFNIKYITCSTERSF